MNRWWWVRHGPTHEKAFVGHRDVPADLSDAAVIARLDAHLPRPALLVSSDLLRARQTADVLARGRNRLAHEPAFREFDFGAWDGLTFDAVAERDPELSRAFWEDPAAAVPPGGEGWHDVAARVAEGVARLSAAHPGADIVAVAHIGVILSQVAAAAGEPPSRAVTRKISNLSVTTIIIGPDGAELGSVNHLP
ncbi:histidine phosphatase family protein [Rhodobacterales bacterium HKCCE3408]|nr:histidine phosphatase family protein [Rhodobacterales bacterium HKCCE3408]